MICFNTSPPGSSIHSVYQELNAELKLLAEHQYKSSINEWPQQSTRGDSHEFAIANPLAWTRHAIVELPEKILDGGPSHYVHSIDEDCAGPTQSIDGKCFALVKLNGLCAMPYSQQSSAKKSKGEPSVMKATPTLMSNGIVGARFDGYGQLCSISIHGEPLLFSKNETASFTIHDDNPEAYDAWDMDHHIIWMKENAIKEPVTLNVVACGPVASILRSDPIAIGTCENTRD